MSPGAESSREPFPSFATGAAVGILGGLIGLGGAEFRLPLLITIFGYATLPAVIVKLVVSLVTVIFSFIFRLRVIGIDVVASQIATFAARNGVFPALLAGEGVTGADKPFEGKHGLWDLITGPFQLQPLPTEGGPYHGRCEEAVPTQVFVFHLNWLPKTYH